MGWACAFVIVVTGDWSQALCASGADRANSDLQGFCNGVWESLAEKIDGVAAINSMVALVDKDNIQTP